MIIDTKQSTKNTENIIHTVPDSAVLHVHIITGIQFE